MALDGLTAFGFMAFASAGAFIGAAFAGNRVAALRDRNRRLACGLHHALHGVENSAARWKIANDIRSVLELPDEEEVVGDFTLRPEVRVHAVGDENV